MIIRSVSALIPRKIDGEWKFAAIRHHRRNQIEFPGGKVTVDENRNELETPEEAMIRESKEELGLPIHSLKAMFTVTHECEGLTYECTMFVAEASPEFDLVSSKEGKAIWATREQVEMGNSYEKTNQALILLWELNARPGV